MNARKIIGVLLVVLLAVGADFGQQLKLRKNGRIVQILEGRKILYKVIVKGKPNRKGRKYDEAFIAGPCLIVRRDIREVDTGTESSPDVSRLEIYRTNGKRRVYYQSDDFEIRGVDDWDLINSPDFTWAIIPENGEGMFEGYYHISPDCRLSEEWFGQNHNFDWRGDRSDASFIDPATLKFSSIVDWADRVQGAKSTKVNILIAKDGNFRVEEIDK